MKITAISNTLYYLVIRLFTRHALFSDMFTNKIQLYSQRQYNLLGEYIDENASIEIALVLRHKVE